MQAHPLMRYLCAVVLRATGRVLAGEAGQCRMASEGQAEITSFDAGMADGGPIRLQGILSGPEGSGRFTAMVVLLGSTALITPVTRAGRRGRRGKAKWRHGSQREDRRPF